MTTYDPQPPEDEPREQDLPPKPEIPAEQMPDEDELVEGAEEVPEEDFLDAETAAADDTVDDAERDDVD